MKVKALALGLALFFIFISCQKDINNPHSNNPSNPFDLPTISYFTATHLHSHPQDYGMNSYFELSWSVIDVVTVSIDQGIGEISATGTKEVQIQKTNTYILTATNGIGQKSASVIAEPPEQAILEVTTIPELPIFTYHPYEDPEAPPYWSSSTSEFIIVITETNGVGGYIHTTVNTYIVGEERCWKSTSFYKEIFEPFGTVQILARLSVLCKPTTMTIRFEGYDNNKCEIDMLTSIPFVWEN